MDLLTTISHILSKFQSSFLLLLPVVIHLLIAAEHNNGMGEFSIKVASATQSSYSKWASMTATITATTGTATATATYSTSPIPTSTSYDYIVVGGGVRIFSFSNTFLPYKRESSCYVIVPFCETAGFRILKIVCSRLEESRWQINLRKVESPCS